MPVQKIEKNDFLLRCWEVFHLNGYYNTSMQNLADATGLQKAGLYHHYPTKEDLMRRVMEFALDQFRSYVLAVADEPDLPPEQRLEKLLRRHKKLATLHRRGCFFANIALETGREDLFNNVLKVAMEEWAAAVGRILAERIPAERAHFVGNTMIDSLVALQDRFRPLGACREFGLEPGSYLLVTLHRPALVDGPLLFDAIAALNQVSTEMPILFPVHPRTRARLAGNAELAENLHLVDPAGYLEFLSLEADAGAVLTDSGGIQEETSYLGVPCFTLRDNTERPVTIELGTNVLLGLDPARITEIPVIVASQERAVAGVSAPPEPPPLWDGHAAERIADLLAAHPVLELDPAAAEARPRCEASSRREWRCARDGVPIHRFWARKRR